jgi:hypothetical protein
MPVGVYQPVGRGACYAFGIPIRARETRSGRGGLKLVIVIHFGGTRAVEVGELLTELRILEVCVCDAVGYPSGVPLSDAAGTLGHLLQNNWDESERRRFVSAVQAASFIADWTYRSPSTKWAYPIDAACGNIAAVVCEGAQLVRKKQFGSYIRYGAKATRKSGLITACYYGPEGAYVSALLARTSKSSSAPP